MKQLMMVTMVVCGTWAALAAPKKAKPTTASAADEDLATGRAAKVLIVQDPKLGQQTCLMAPAVPGPSLIGQCYKKPRQWIVLETKYETFGRENPNNPTVMINFQDQLTFTWHVLLDTKLATENKGNREELAAYSYFTTSTTYFNIPKGQHAASVVLPPSYRERYGEPKAVGLEITNEKGQLLAGDCWSEISGIKPHTKFWEDNNVMNATDKTGKPMIERRQGLVDRSKTIWALVNPNDYEATMH